MAASTHKLGQGSIVVLGGYGHVGRILVERLAELFPKRVVVAGHDGHKASELARRVGSGTTARQVDVPTDWESALEGAAVLVMCLDMEDSAIAQRCLESGVGYVDITASERLLESIEALDGVAAENSATALISVGLVPGLSNILAATALDSLRGARPVESLDIFVLLGLGDAHGRAATTWTLQRLDESFRIQRQGVTRRVRGFRGSASFQLPGEKLRRRAYHFPFPDQQVIARARQVPSVATWLCFGSRVATEGLAALVALGGSRLLKLPSVVETVSRVCEQGGFGSDRWAVGVRATGASGARGWLARGHSEAYATGMIAAEAVRCILGGGVSPGCHHLDQVLSLQQLTPLLESMHVQLDLDCEL